MDAWLTELAECIWERRLTLGPDLGHGAAGAALYLGHLARRSGFSRYRVRAAALLEQAFEGCRADPGFGLFSGSLGPAWTFLHLAPLLGWEGDSTAFRELDERLEQHLGTGAGPFDLADGWVGIGVYLRERGGTPRQAERLAQLREKLRAAAREEGKGSVWPTLPEHLPPPYRSRAPKGLFNLSLLEGGQGPLALALAWGDARGIKASATGLEGLRKEGPLPNAREAHGNRAPLGRMALGWNQGDLGASLLFWHAGRRLGQSAWMNLARRMSKGAALQALSMGAFQDVSLIRGSAGCLHLFRHMQRIWGSADYISAVEAAYSHVKAGWSSLVSEEFGVGLLEGASGVGLALLDLDESSPRGWDRLFLLPERIQEEAIPPGV